MNAWAKSFKIMGKAQFHQLSHGLLLRSGPVRIPEGAGKQQEMCIRDRVYAGDHLGKRSRYYAANMDVDMLMSGISYEKLKKTYVIFICTHDYMKKGEAVYFFQRYDVEKQLPFNDESYILILNASCNPCLLYTSRCV